MRTGRHLSRFIGIQKREENLEAAVKGLESNGDLYWITGKPGSGKSTLMKFLYENPRTWQCLRSWHRRQPLVTAGFFFWNPGNQMQMSSMGLLQTLLFECLPQRRHLVSVTFPDRWESYLLFGEDLHPWTWEKLYSAFKIFINEAVKTNKFVFLH